LFNDPANKAFNDNLEDHPVSNPRSRRSPPTSAASKALPEGSNGQENDSLASIWH
jgi:hypothetical protein